MPPLTRSELRLSGFCRMLSGFCFAGAVLFAFAPAVSYRMFSLGKAAEATPESRFWSVLAAALLVASATALSLVAPRPRERRHAVLPVLAALAASFSLAALQIAEIGAENALVALAIVAVTLFALTAAVYRASAPGVNIAPSPQPAARADPGTVQLGIGVHKT